MIIADFFDLAVLNLHHFRTDSLDASLARSRPRKVRLRNSPAAVAGTHTQVTMRIMKQRELSLVRAPDLRDADHPLAIGTHEHRLVVKTRYDPLEVVPVECIEVTLDKLLFRSHFSLQRSGARRSAQCEQPAKPRLLT